MTFQILNRHMKHPISELTGIDLSIFNNSFVESTINGRMGETNCRNLEDYLAYLKHNSAEIDQLRNALTNHYSIFFRNTLTFSFLEQHILPLLAQQKQLKQNREIRIWSAACAAGQEAYSIAMVCDELLKQNHPNVRFHIFATDISSDEIAKAQRGLYSESALKNISLDRIKKYFSALGNVFKVNQQLKESIDFSTFDLLSEEGMCPASSIFGNFDIIFCANLLFYYQPEIQAAILKKLNSCLVKGGWLIVGDAEKEIVLSNTGYNAYKYFTVLQKPSINSGESI